MGEIKEILLGLYSGKPENQRHAFFKVLFNLTKLENHLHLLLAMIPSIKGLFNKSGMELIFQNI